VKERKRMIRCFWGAVVLLTLMSASFLLMPLNIRIALGYLPALSGNIFWLSAIIGYLLVARANSARKRMEPENCAAESRRVGILTWFSNRPAIGIDALLILSTIGLIAVLLIDGGSSYLAFVLLFLVVLSLNLHGLFNGRIYQTIKEQESNRPFWKERNQK
jgi:hypothetical protein